MNIKPTNKKALNWLFSAHLINDTYSNFLNPIMPFIAVKVGITMAVAALIMSLAQICASLFQPVFGFFADNTLKRFFVFWGLIFGSVFVAFSPITPNVYLLTLFVILGNLGGSFFHPQALGFISKFSNGDFVLNTGIFITAGTIGAALGPVISSFVTQYFGLNEIPYLAAAGVICALIMFAGVPKSSNTAIKINRRGFSKSFKEILSNKSMNILIFIAIMKSFITNSSLILLPFLWKDVGHNPLYIGIALFLFMFTGGAGSFISGRVEEKIGAKKVFYISMIATLPIMALFILTYKIYPILSVGIFIVMGFTTMLAQPVMIIMAQKILPDYKSIVSGFINGFAWGVAAIFIAIVGFAAQTFGITKVLMFISFLPAVCSYFVKFLPDVLENND